MRLLASAIVVGLALAGGLLGLGADAHSKAHSHMPGLVGPQPVTRYATSYGGWQRPDRSPQAHSNANSEGNTVWLNPKLIRGERTVVCTTDAEVYPRLRDAVSLWASALSGRIAFRGGGGPFRLHDNTSQSPRTCPESGVNDVDVVVVRTDRSGGAYLFVPQTSPPRKLFKTKSKTEAHLRSDDHATIAIPNGDIRISTLVHELGHVLGLSDYKTCDGLRVKGAGPAAVDPDLNDQHFALMYTGSDRRCRPRNESTITDRDLRDLYEAYHVGAVTNLSLQRNVEIGSNEITVHFYWGEHGLDELYHNASHVAVFAQDIDAATWSRVGLWTMPEDRKRVGMSMKVDVPGVESVLPSGPSRYPTRFKLVGLTRGDIRWLGRQVNSPANQPKRWTFDREVEVASEAYTEGDPAYLTGTLVSGNQAVSNPRVLSASLSPRDC